MFEVKNICLNGYLLFMFLLNAKNNLSYCYGTIFAHIMMVG